MRNERNNFIPGAVTVIILAAAGWGLFHIAHRECWRCDKQEFWQRGLEFACSDDPDYRDNSLKFIETASDQGNVEAAFFLAELALGEANGTAINCLRHKVPVNKELAVSNFKKLEKLLDPMDSPPALTCARLGTLYLDGKIPSDSPEKNAEKWFLKAAENGNFYAMQALGKIYDARDDYISALKWFERAADDKNNFESAVISGDYFFYGKGVDPDWLQALSWYKRALNMGKVIYAALPEDKRKEALDPAAARIETVNEKIKASGGEPPLVIHYRLDGGSSLYRVFAESDPEVMIGEVTDNHGRISATLAPSVSDNGENGTKKDGLKFMNQGLKWLLDTFAKARYGENRLFIYRIRGQNPSI